MPMEWTGQPEPLLTYDEALRFLDQRINYEKMGRDRLTKAEWKLDRMRQLLALLGNPHEKVSVVHVAGTKGKGSSATMIASILGAAGYRVGLYTSPHLERVEERIAIGGMPCTEEQFAELLSFLKPNVLAMEEELPSDSRLPGGPTYFEITTAMAFLCFARENVDLAVMEVGLGGRLDSTNVCHPVVSVITSISYDHTRQLGNTLESIAREKAGIIKPGIPTISGVLESPAREVIAEKAHAAESRFIELGQDFSFDYEVSPGDDLLASLPRCRFHGSAIDTYWPNTNDVELAMLGRHQAANAAIAVATVGELCRQDWRVPWEAVARGLREARCPARVEVVQTAPLVVVDAAHNVASIEAFCQTLEECFTARRQFLIFAASHEKDVSGMLRVLLSKFDEIWLTRHHLDPRTYSPEELFEIASSLGEKSTLRVVATTAQAWQEIGQRAAARDLVCVTGSFFLAAEMRAIAADSPIMAQPREQTAVPTTPPAGP